jgi:hypothetical protein
MFKRIAIDQLRGFEHFHMQNLGRVNLIVGTNNSGKTTVLEAIQMLASTGDISSIFKILSRRGEDWWDLGERARTRHVDVRRLFNGHEIKTGCRFDVHATTGQNTEHTFTGEIIETPRQPESLSPKIVYPLARSEDSDEVPSLTALRLTWDQRPETDYALTINPKGGLALDMLRRSSIGFVSSEKARLITSSALSPESVIDLFESVVLTKDEELVIEALNIIEPSIERIATSGGERMRGDSTRGGVLVRCKGIDHRIPIGSMGDGIWRMLGIALALVRSGNGILLIDEIDTGLHFTVMADMWRLIYKTAKRLNVQVFATTHSRDCYESLAVICREQVSDGSDITIQRIEKKRKAAVGYTEQEIVAAADRGMEVR